MLAAFCDGADAIGSVETQDAVSGPTDSRFQRLLWRTASALFPDDYAETYGFGLLPNSFDFGFGGGESRRSATIRSPRRRTSTRSTRQRRRTSRPRSRRREAVRMSDRCDVLIVGAGIAGSSLAFELAGQRDVVLLEREAQPGYHSTGRSAAMLTATYGAPPVRALARASHDFLAAPPPGFAETALLSPRGMLHLARADQLAALEARPARPRCDAWTLPAVCDLVPLLDPAYVAGGLLEPDAMAIDVAALHQGYLRGRAAAAAGW